jgi:hypothetical protein
MTEIGEDRDVLIGEPGKGLSEPFLVVSNTEMQGTGGTTLIRADVAGESQLGSEARQLRRAVLGLDSNLGQNVDGLNVSDGENSGTRPDLRFSAHLEGESLSMKEGKLIVSQHIRFAYQDSDLSDFSDSVDEVPNDHMLLKHCLKQRHKRK